MILSGKHRLENAVDNESNGMSFVNGFLLVVVALYLVLQVVVQGLPSAVDRLYPYRHDEPEHV